MTSLAFATLTFPSPWVPVADGDHRVWGLHRRHYSSGKNRRPALRLSAGPGEKLLLLTIRADALIIWRKFRSLDHQEGINCALFRNEGHHLSSWLIQEADRLAWQRWPGQRHYTYVNPRQVAGGLPGACFLFAGWRYVRAAGGHRYRTTKGLFVLERLLDA